MLKLVSIPTYKAASPNTFFALPGFEQDKGKVAINVSVFWFNRCGNYSQSHNNAYLIDVLLEDDKNYIFRSLLAIIRFFIRKNYVL